MDTQVLQSIASWLGLVIGVVYILGALISNFQLSRYGVTEYQILRIKYLAVGLIFLVNFMGSCTLALLIAFLSIFSDQIGQILFILSLSAALWLLWWGAKPPQLRNARLKKILESWSFLFLIVAVICIVFPLRVILQHILLPRATGFDTLVLNIEGIISGVVSIIGYIYSYARFGYIEAGFDPIGTGAPVYVQLSGHERDIAQLKLLGVPMARAGLSDKVLLLDETDTHYIVGILNGQKTLAVKITKDVIQAILYLGRE